MNLSRKRQLILFCIIYCIVLLAGIFQQKDRLTYLERYNLNVRQEMDLVMHDERDVLRQDFVMPYDMIHSVEIRIGTNARVNNSQWEISIVDPADNHVVCSQIMYASLIVDDEYYSVAFDHNTHVRKGETYTLMIRPLQVTENTGLTFYASTTAVEGNELYLDDEQQDGRLCLKVYGGDPDYWWIGFYVVLMLLVAATAAVYFHEAAAGTATVRGSLMLQGMLVAIVVFLLWMTFAATGYFIDESDNVRGGMVIAHGSVLYRDYVTQHTPFVYYLCSVFALLGASSVEQMRYLYYLLQAILWGFLYYRHARYYGKSKMLLLPVMECILIITILSNRGWMILSDNVQALCMVVLALEFLRYTQDHLLDVSRAIIISLCIWLSIGSAFVSAYALVWPALLFMLHEFQMAIKDRQCVTWYLRRYGLLLVMVLIPPTAGCTYFAANSSLREVYDQAFRFNTEVYPLYNEGYGSNVLQPFINAVQNLLNIPADVLTTILATETSDIGLLYITQFVRLAIIFIAIAILIAQWRNRQYYETVALFCLFCFSATRGYDFHGMAAWYIAVMIIATHYEMLLPFIHKCHIPVAICIGVFLCGGYLNSIGSNLLTSVEPVTEMETAVVEHTQEGDRVLIDGATCDSVYLMYKDRYPANRCSYFLPWYMNWFEQATIDDVDTTDPKVIVYNANRTVWTDYTAYTPALLSRIQENYVQFSANPDDGWEYYVWVRK